MDSFNGGVHVRFEKMEKTWCFNPAVLERLSNFSLNQIVRVRNDESTVRTIQAKLGNKMAYSVIINYLILQLSLI